MSTRPRRRQTITLPATSWEEFGAEAFEVGLPRIPGADPRVTDAITGLPVGAGAAGILRAWTRGWDAANLAQPVTID